MELLYFISGILSVGIAYSIVLLRKNQSHYHDALARLQSFMNVSSIRVEELKEKVGVVEEKYSDIILKLEKDQYSSVSEINNRIGEQTKMTNAINERVSQNQKILETSISRTTTEINTLRHNLKQLGQDPNFIK